MVLSFPGTFCAKLSCQLVTLLVQSWDKCILYNVLLQPVQRTGGAVRRPTGPTGPFRAAEQPGQLVLGDIWQFRETPRRPRMVKLVKDLLRLMEPERLDRQREMVRFTYVMPI